MRAKYAEAYERDLATGEAARLEKLTLAAKAQAQRAGLDVREWLAGLPEGERGKWAGVEETLACWERVPREKCERDNWRDRLYLARDQKGVKDSLSYWFLVYAEHELRVQGIGLDDQRAVDYTLDLMAQGSMTDDRVWYERVHG
jgi:hypothetical protein